MTSSIPEPASDAPDLTTCDQEPIHRLGQLQQWGFLLCAGADETVRLASENVAAHLGLPAEAVIGRNMDELFEPGAMHDIRGRLQGLAGLDQTDRLFGVRLLAGKPPYDVSVHYAPGDAARFVMEAEPSLPAGDFDPIATVKGMMARLLRAEDMQTVHDLAARQLRRVLGYDRVMVYRFEADGSGEVVGESVVAHLESFRGLRYPATDIPAQARALYCRNWLRLIADLGAPTQSIVPPPPPGELPLDLSSSILRGVSPVHIEYLRNMGVAASLSISIMRGGALWGLLACHHSQPLLPNFQRRSAAELFGQLYSLQVESRERADAERFDTVARAMNDRVLDSLSDDSDPMLSIGRIVEEVRVLVPCDGVAIHSLGRTEVAGITPDGLALRGILALLNETNTPRVFATTEIGRHYPQAAQYAGMAAGMLVIPISRAPGDYLMLFRREMVHTVSWAGNPDKAPEPGTTRLSPRRSFAIWRQTMRGQCAPWLDAELRVAESLRIVLLEVMVRRLSNAAAERSREASKQQELLIGELNHRVRNILALIRALVARSRESAATLENFVASLDGRIQSLARAHDQLTDDRWGPVSLSRMIENEFQAYMSDGEQARALMSGPPVLVEPRALTVLALVVHEMATNSVKYGALSGNGGCVEVSWKLDGAGALVIAWRETGGPTVVPPSRRGFGSTVIERTVPLELQGTATVRYEADGLEADFTIPARFVRPGIEMPRRAPIAPVPAPAIAPGGIAMVLEDSALLAMDAEEILLGLGFKAVEVVGTSAAALDALTRIDGELAFALLDINLGDHTSLPVARELLRQGIPFAFATGDGKNSALSPEMAAAATVIRKPYRPEDIASLLGRTPTPR